ncbi:serine/threonine-protein kinase Pkn1 [Abditibacteriota bacterium]|nr:serine/threonine-protein kinase Pkn1 [Abditibacteriota bacterium]
MALPPGTKLNNNSFSIGRVLGQGGFGITYKGNDINLARLVAIKELFPEGSRRQGITVLPPPSVSPTEWDRARHEAKEEAKTVARFRHPGIVNVYFVWEENGTAYQAMEFLDGQSVGGLFEKGKLSELEVLPIIERVVDALETMHASGFIHRDLKPDNIVQTKDGRTVLIDFGTAKQFVREKTQKLNPVLTPGYAPLEQYSSQARFDHRLDIYALGATLYHLLTGEIPVSAVERAAGVDLSSVRDKNPLVSVAVSDAIERAMAVKVGDRFDSAREFARELRATKQTTVSTAQKPGKQRSLSQIKGSVTPAQLNHLAVFDITRAEAKTLSEAEAFAIIEHMGSSSSLLFSRAWKDDAREFFNKLKISSGVTPQNIPLPAQPQHSEPNQNPYLAQIRSLLVSHLCALLQDSAQHEEVKAASFQPSSKLQEMLEAIERELKPLSDFSLPAAINCPACHQDAVKLVPSAFSGNCPFDGTPLSRIEWPLGKCAMCRVGMLQFHELGTGEFMCAVCCRDSVRRVERPGFLGLLSAWEFECPTCRAQYASVGSTAARLKQVVAPYGPIPLMGQARPFSQWNEAANATGIVADCSNCQAHFIEQKNGELRLMAWHTDPYGIIQNLEGLSQTPERWAQLAAGAGPDTSTHHCPTCHARWKVDLNDQSLTLLRAIAPEQEQMRKWGFALAKPYPVKSWMGRAAGKISGEPGRTCTNCRTEFDERLEPEMFALVSTQNTLLNGHFGQVLSWSDWHRFTQKLPLSDGEQTLRDEAAQLNAARSAEIAQQYEAVRNHRRQLKSAIQSRHKALNAELDILYKSAVIEGAVELDLLARFLRVGDKVLWTCPGTLWKYNSRTGWRRDVSSQFVLKWDCLGLDFGPLRPFNKILGVGVENHLKISLLVVDMAGLQNPVGFSLESVQAKVVIEDLPRSISLDIYDVAAMVKHLMG